MKLISITDFVLHQYEINQSSYNFWKKIGNYAKFLKQPLELWMFVPCDENGNVFEEPERWNDYLEFPESFDGNKEWYEFYTYQQAKERCLFDGFEVEFKANGNRYVHRKDIIYFASTENDKGLFRLYSKYKTIEDLVKYNLQLTPTAIKQIGL